MKSLLFTCLFALTACFVGAQHNQYPILSQQQMYQDYDTLVSTLLQISPQPPFRKELTEFDITRFYKQNRSKIKDIKTLQEFYLLIRSTSTANQDAHTGLMRAELMPADMMKSQGISDSAISYIPAYAVWYAEPAIANHLNLQLSYVNGRYFNMRSFSYKNKIYKRGIELTGCNGKPIKTYVNELYPFLNMKWDVIHHCYFSESFFKSFNLSARDTLNLKFEGIPNDAAFGVADSVSFIGDGLATSFAPKEVVYLPDLKILYIRMPAMSLPDTSFYPEQILRYKNKAINKVVFDIRGNHGGSDWVWRSALSAIIDKPIIITETIIMNRSEKIKRLFTGQFDTSGIINVPLLGNKAFYISYHGNDTVPKSKSSIDYGGKIYVLQDKYIYSSAGAFSTFANMASNFYTVGEHTGAQLGIGMNPAYFELPNSKIIYRVEPVIDYTDVEEASDILHDRVKIPVSLDFQTLVELMTDEDRYSTTFLVVKDPYFKAVLKN